ncbi:MAG: hypothetical protein BZ151_13305 [Desulfobacca sp. 4484_104]|nr:MAG: hypothetical protein BZ151_13305 [Desulfobacca sp. 4484_104]
MLYMEGIDNPTHFLAAVKKHQHKKPVIIYKTGSAEKSNQAAKSHTGSMAGKPEIYQGAFSQAGILSLNSAQSLLDTGKALAAAHLPTGDGVAVLSGQAGPALTPSCCSPCLPQPMPISWKNCLSFSPNRNRQSPS